MRKKVVFTDLDGTLLNKNYSAAQAKSALKILKEMEIPVVFVSSKTQEEIDYYRNKLANNHPFIVENGGAIFIPHKYFDDIQRKNQKFKKKGKYDVIELGVSYAKIKKVLRNIEKKIPIIGFSDMTSEQIAKSSGLSLKSARLAKKRGYDEAFTLKDEKFAKKLFKIIKKYGLNYTHGGRYYHILGNNDKGKAVKILSLLYKEKFGDIETISLGDSINDKPMLNKTNKGFLITGPKDWNRIIKHLLRFDDPFVKKSEELYINSKKVLKKLQLKNGAVLASKPGGRYPYIYPRDHAICILGFLSAEMNDEARKALIFILDGQNKDGSFPQRLDKQGFDASYKPIQLDNVGLVLYAFSKYIQKTKNKVFLEKYAEHVKVAVNYLETKFDKKKNLFITPNSIHEFPPLEQGYEIWANSVCYGALKQLKEIGINSKINLEIFKKSIEKYFWEKNHFIKNIRIKDSSSIVKEIDASSYALAYFGVFEDNNPKIKKNVKMIEKELWNKELGGICRYKKYIGRNNGGWGPWVHFTLMISRHYINNGNLKKSKKYLDWVIKTAYKNLLPEHIATKKEFEEWIEEYRMAGILRKDRKIMIKNIRKFVMYKKKGIAYSVLPLAWPHAEFIMTWNLYKEKFF